MEESQRGYQMWSNDRGVIGCGVTTEELLDVCGGGGRLGYQL